MIFAIIIVAALAVLAVSFMRSQPTKRAEVTIGSNIFYADVADTDMLRAKGLMGRTHLEENEGMIFLFDTPSSSSFWMKGMKISLDIIWIANNRVAGVSENLSPDTSFMPRLYYPPAPVDRVFEAKAGAVAARGIHTGDIVTIKLE